LEGVFEIHSDEKTKKKELCNTNKCDFRIWNHPKPEASGNEDIKFFGIKNSIYLNFGS